MIFKEEPAEEAKAAEAEKTPEDDKAGKEKERKGFRKKNKEDKKTSNIADFSFSVRFLKFSNSASWRFILSSSSLIFSFKKVRCFVSARKGIFLVGRYH